MEINQETTIVAQMQPIFDALPEKLKDEKIRQGLTNQQLSDISGVPIATTSRILTGAVSNPGIFYIAALCTALGISMDAMMGAQEPPKQSADEAGRLEAELAHKEELLAEKEKAIERLLDRSRIQESGIAARDEQIRRQDAEIRAVRNSYKPLVYGLCGLSISAFGLLLGVLAAYLVADYSAPEQGFIRGGVLPVWLEAAVAGIICIGLYIAHWAVKHRLKSKNPPAE